MTSPLAGKDHQPVRQFYEDVAERTLDRKTRRGIQYRNQSILRRLGSPGRILEVGPGEGWLVEMAIRAGETAPRCETPRPRELHASDCR